jgi:hypothetical protein
MQNTQLDDPLLATADPDRVNYELGVMLDARDFVDEQTYHRGRMARVLGALHGAGTVAGLAVDFVPGRAPTAPRAGDGREPELRVNPGLAIDRFGRLIEVPRAWCLDLTRWWGPAALAADTDDETRRRVESLRRAFKAPQNKVVADLFIRFLPCGRGKTPAFARGVAEALDATVYARVRDGFELRLMPRSEDAPPRPVDPWANLPGANPAARLAALHERQLAGWMTMVAPPPPVEVPTELLGVPAPGLPADGSHDPRSQWLLLARVNLPATAATGNGAPRPNGTPTIDNLIRSFVVVPAAVAALLP